MSKHLIPAELANLALHEDIDLVALSEEQCAVLWRSDTGDAGRDGLALSPVLTAGLRALIAAGLVDLHDGEVRTHGPATLVRAARTERRRVLVWTPTPDSRRPGVVWIVLTERLLLEQRETFPGVYQFTLREVRRAATELASELAFEAHPEPADPITWTDDEAARTRVRETLTPFPVASELLALDSGPFTGSQARASAMLRQLTLRSALAEDRGPMWGIRQDRDTTPVVAPIDRKSLRRWVLDSITAPSDHNAGGNHGATS